MTIETPAELAVLLAGCLEAIGIPYAVGGAVAYGFWGAPRGTQGLDLNLFLPAEHIGPALDALVAVRLRRRGRHPRHAVGPALRRLAASLTGPLT